MAASGGPSPGNTPPNYNPNSLVNNMQNLQMNRPTLPPHSVANSGAPRPPTPFGQQSSPFPSSALPSSTFPGGSPMAHPGPPPPGVFPRASVPPGGLLQATLRPSVDSNGPSGPPVTRPSPFGSRPPPPGSLPSSMGSSSVPPSGSPPGAFPSSVQVVAPLGSRPGMPASSPLMTRSPMPPSSTPGPISNGPPMFESGPLQGGPRFPPAGGMPRPPVGPPPSSMFLSGPRSQVPDMHPLVGSPSANALPGTMQPSPPFSAPPQGVAPPSGSSPFSARPQGMPSPSGSSPFSVPSQGLSPPSGSPYGPQTWLTQPRQVAPPPPVPASAQPPRMVGMPPTPNQSIAAISPAMDHMGASMAGSSKIDPNQIPRPIPSSSVLLYETRQGNQANPPPPATSDYIVTDTGNCSPRYLRCTINQIPCTGDLLTTSGMQLALLVQPLALPHQTEEPIQVID